MTGWRTATLSPLRRRIFAAIWTATLISNLGTLIQVVGASWLMTSLAPSAEMVSLVPAAAYFPTVLLSLLAGATADILNRRLIMLSAQILMFLLSAVLTAVVYLGTITPWTLLTLIFFIGCCAAVYLPAWQSSIGEQVERSEISAAVSLNSLALNLARTVGPAIGGVLVASAGPPAAFLVNSSGYLALIAVLLFWRKTRTPAHLPPESMLAAMRAGIGYVRLCPPLLRILLRAVAFGVPASTLSALMPLVARNLVGGGPVTYGMLFSSFGAGAVLGALSSASARMRHGNERVVCLSMLGFGLATAATAISSWQPATMVALVVSGACWVASLSTLNTAVQTSSPPWVVGRTVSIYQMVQLGSLAISSALSGVLATRIGLPATLLCSGGLMCVSALLGHLFPLPHSEGANLSPLRTWPADSHSPPVELGNLAPVIVTVEYRVALEDVEAFRQSMRELGRIRTRDGMQGWSLLQDTADPRRWIETYHSPNWVEYLRCHHRFTVADQEVESRVLALHRKLDPPLINYLIEHLPREGQTGPAACARPLEPRLKPAGRC